MTNPNMSGTGPLAQHHNRYSQDGLFLRYVRGQLRMFWPRMTFIALVCLILWGIVSAQTGLFVLIIACSAEGIDGLYMRYAYRQVKDGADSSSQRRISTVTAFLHGVGLAFGAAAPFWADAWFGAVGTEMIDPVFTVGLLAGGAINAGLFYPYHRWAAIARLSVCAIAPVIILATGLLDHNHMGFQLQLAGLLILYGALIWHLIFVIRSFSRTRSILLTQALQQQELEGAYQRLLKQQVEAKRLALVARHANDSVLLIDNDNKVQWVNEAFTRMTGFLFEEALGREPGELLNHPDTAQAAIEKIAQGRQEAVPFRLEILNRHKDGRDIWLETNQVPVPGGASGEMSYIAIERDITVAKLHEQQLNEARKAAEEGDRAKSDFLATMSHEIRTPMNGVIGMAQLLEDTALDADQLLYTETILSSARTLLALINDILDLSKLDAGQVTLNPCDFDLHRCFDETIRLLRTQAEAKGLELMVEYDPDLPLYLHGDDHRMRQILINLVGNAIKFTEKGRVKVTVEAEPLADGQVMLGCAIIDTGIGIPREMLTGIFERFSQADAAISRRFGGSGLGLAISQRLAEAMGGRIIVRSEVGVGSCFTIALPFDLAKSPETPAVTAMQENLVVAPMPKTPAMPKGEGQDSSDSDAMLAGVRLLVAEDNRVNRLLIQRFLKGCPLDLEFAFDGGEAVDKAEQFKPDVILMDVSMPVMDGLEATQIIRSWGQPQPAIIALTANAFDTDREACLAAGMDEFVTKPINRRQLLDVIAKFSNQQQDQRTG